MRLRNERRWQFVVDKDLQNRIVVASSWPIGIASVISLVVLAIFGLHLKRVALEAGIDVSGLLPLFAATALLFVYGIVSQVIIALKLSHRIAGSAYRIAKTLQAFRHGDRDERVSLRRGDLHGNLAHDVNSFLDWVAQDQGVAGRPRLDARPEPRSTRTRRPAGKAGTSKRS